MKNKKTLIIQIIAVVLLIALGYAMTIYWPGPHRVPGARRSR